MDHVDELFPVAGCDGESPVDLSRFCGAEVGIAVGADLGLAEGESPVVVLQWVGCQFGPGGEGAEEASENFPGVFHAFDAVVCDPFGEHEGISSRGWQPGGASRSLKAEATSPVKETCCVSRLVG